MALDQSALSELLGALRAGGGLDVVRLRTRSALRSSAIRDRSGRAGTARRCGRCVPRCGGWPVQSRCGK
jgi:hypothetical protein